MTSVRTPLKLSQKVVLTSTLFVVVHLAVGGTTLAAWLAGDEILPFPALWWSLHFVAAATVAAFLRWPERGTRALAGSLSISAFSGRATAFVWVILFDRDSAVYDRLGVRTFLGVAVWTAMAVMGELLWWWLSGYRRQEE